MSMIFMKERFAHSGQHRERLKQLLGYSSHRDHLLKSLGKKLGDALRNYDEYKQAKDNYEYWKEELLAAVNEGLGKTHGWPLSDLRDLVKRIKEKANAPVLPPVPIDPILAGMGRVIASAEQARNK
jgi:hypothetical protein